jgi:hypothetical protein
MNLQWVVTGIVLLGGMVAGGISLYLKRKRKKELADKPDEMLNKPVTFNVNHDDLPPMKERVNGPISVEVVVTG